jgi:PAS domain S-box-containing protein
MKKPEFKISDFSKYSAEISILINHECIITEISKNAALLIGSTYKDLIGQRFSDKHLRLFDSKGRSISDKKWPWIEFLNNKAPFPNNVILGVKTMQKEAFSLYSILITPFYGHHKKIDYLLLKFYDVNIYKSFFNSIIYNDDKFFISFERSPFPMALSLNNTTLWPNEALCKLLGYNKIEILNIKLKDIIQPDDVNLFNLAQDKLLNHETTKEEFIQRFNCKNGIEITCQITLMSYEIYDQLGSPSLIITSYFKQIERQEKINLQNELIVDYFNNIKNDVIIITDQHFNIKFINKAHDFIDWASNDIVKYIINRKKNNEFQENGIFYKFKSNDIELRTIRWTCEDMHLINAYFFIGRELTERFEILKKNKDKLRIKNLQLLQRTILTVSEELRNKYSAELHDNILQLLFMSKLLLENEISNSRRGNNNTLIPIYDLVVKANKDLRDFTHELSSNLTSCKNLHDDLAFLLDKFMLSSNIRLSLSIEDAFKINDSFVRVNIYRIIQELLNNVLKHSGAKSIILKIEKSNKLINIQMIDDGIGFKQNNKFSGIGFKNINFRVVAMNGKINIKSSPNMGTDIKITINLNKETFL